MKNYVKPSISFQFMTLADDVSAGCSMSTNKAEYVCAVEIPDNPGLTIFTDSNSHCVMQPADYGAEICYGTPIENNNVLGS